jgi:Protein of unknown function (DUF3465)
VTRKPIRRIPYATLIAIVVVGVYYLLDRGAGPAPTVVAPQPQTSSFDEHFDGTMIESIGVVDRLLPDDTDGTRHQRFILRLGSGQTLLVAHNIDLAPRIEDLARGDTVKFRGRYEVNERGGGVHWTHHDPGGKTPGGWLGHKGRRYR